MRWGIWWLTIFPAFAALCGARAARAQAPSPGSEPDRHVTADQAKARAQEHLDRGNALLNQRAFEEALAEFRAAYGRFPSPKILYNEAEAERELGRFVDAAKHYDLFLHEFSQTESDEDAERIVTARESVQRALSQIAIIDPDAPTGVEVLVDARSFGKIPLAEPLHIDPGHHRVSFRRAGLIDSNRDVLLSPGQRLRLVPDPILLGAGASPPPRSIWRRWPFWAVTGAAILGGIAAIFVVDYYNRPPCPRGAYCSRGE